MRYGNHEENLKPTHDFSGYDLFLTNPTDSTSKAQKLPNPSISIFEKPSAAKPPKPQIRVDKPAKGSKTIKSKILPSGKNAISTVYSSSNPRSLPTSPALNGVGSPSLNPAFTASQQKLEKNKEQRSALVHELAVRDQTLEHLRAKWTGSEADFNDILKRVGDQVKDQDKWSLKKLFWKELDVWNYDYESQEDRQAAVENAIKVYDKQRLSSGAPEWERLLPKEERGKGIVLSKLQDRLAKGNITPVPKASKADDASKNSSDESSRAPGAEAMSRSNSQTVVAKPKAKISDREAQAKRLLSNKPKKAAPPKKAPASKTKATEKGAKKVLSAEFVQDSSSSEDEPIAPTTTAKSKPAEKTMDKAIEKLAEKVSEKPKVPAPAAKPKPKAVVRAPKSAAVKAPAASKASTPATSTLPKRPRDEEDSSSSSGAPLAKRLTKPKEAPKPLPNSTALKHRPSDASQNSRATTSSNHSYKSKNTSPAKSSPLASSPPTNASDFDDDDHGRSQSHSQSHSQSQSQTQRSASRVNGLTNGTAAPAKKRKEPPRDGDVHVSSKKARVSMSVLQKAQSFEVYYRRYLVLHNELVSIRDPPQDDIDRLVRMRQRLVTMKDEIAQEQGAAA